MMMRLCYWAMCVCKDRSHVSAPCTPGNVPLAAGAYKAAIAMHSNRPFMAPVGAPRP